MILDHFIKGPTFSKGDILSFIFRDSTLSLRIPVVQRNRSTANFVSAVSDFRAANYNDWEEVGDGRSTFTLVEQSWKYEDPNSHDDLAHAFLSVDILRHNQADVANKLLLNSKLFCDFFITQICEDFGLSSEELSANIIQNVDIDGLIANLPLGPEQDVLSPVIFLSLGGELSLRLTFKFGVMHYPDKENPLCSEVLCELHNMLLDDLLSNINIEYCSDTLFAINQLKLTSHQ